LRIGEVVRLKLGSIDSERMLLHIGDGKDGRDRYAMLSPRLLEILRAYWRRARPRECRRFSHTWKSHRKDRTGWLGRQDSNLGMAESKSTCFAFDFKDHSEKSAKFDPFPINRLDADSECAGGPAEALWCVLITLAFAMIVFLTAWHGPDCRSPSGQFRLGVRS